ncbi:MAG TPA: 50S ribosomal protein L6 [Defluviitoga sp.]|nr:50S ribosomal protein L6 [Defluviitoga sp.]HOP25141.1 50S ribosomal protein L6 [Defluviitoga sp.]HPZ28341.1 50S ribosomal protein L6 [Defluviitoga sp.]HQD62231.1 50S ribosomal protein L6 [Defluviitoga sp.]
MSKSRVADKPTVIPEEVQVSVEDNLVKVKGKKGELSLFLPKELELTIRDNELMVVGKEQYIKRAADRKKLTALRGTYTSLIRNMITGVTEGYQKELEVLGIGYRAQVQDNTLILNIGYSNPVVFEIPDGIIIEVPQPTRIIVKGIDKYLVGEVAARIKSLRKVNVYSGKGIKYADEVVVRKKGKKV